MRTSENADTYDYIVDMLVELAQMARVAGIEKLASQIELLVTTDPKTGQAA